MAVILITGAAGRIGTMLRPRLARPGRTLRVLDIAPLTAGPGVTVNGPEVPVLEPPVTEIVYVPTVWKSASK